MSATFEKQMRALVEPVQHTLSERTRQLLADLRRLRILLLCASRIHSMPDALVRRSLQLRATLYASLYGTLILFIFRVQSAGGLGCGHLLLHDPLSPVRARASLLQFSHLSHLALCCSTYAIPGIHCSVYSTCMYGRLIDSLQE